MPYVIRRPHKRAMALAAACFALLAAAHPSPAAAEMGLPGSTAACPIPLSSQVFAPLGDSSYYAPVPGGTFEGDVAGWSLNGASVVSGNEPWNVGGSGDSHSLSIASGGTAVTAPVCINSLFPSWRFFALAADGDQGTTLRVAARVSQFGRTFDVPVASLNGSSYTSWTPTSSLPLGSVLPPGFNVTVRFVFTADSNGGAWTIDDTYLDPYAR
jgi:hypothetical protein